MIHFIFINQLSLLHLIVATFFPSLSLHLHCMVFYQIVLSNRFLIFVIRLVIIHGPFAKKEDPEYTTTWSTVHPCILWMVYTQYNIIGSCINAQYYCLLNLADLFATDSCCCFSCRFRFAFSRWWLHWVDISLTIVKKIIYSLFTYLLS